MKKTVSYNGFGFPVLLKDWPHLKIDGVWEPDIPYRGIEALLFNKMPFKFARIWGAEVKFIRHHMGMTQEEFAGWLGFSVADWEKADLKPSHKMNPNKEMILRWKLMEYESPSEKDIDITVRLKAAPLWEMSYGRESEESEEKSLASGTRVPSSD